MIEKLELIEGVFASSEARPKHDVASVLRDLAALGPASVELWVQSERRGVRAFARVVAGELAIVDHILAVFAAALGATTMPLLPQELPTAAARTPLERMPGPGAWADAVGLIADASSRDGSTRWLCVWASSLSPAAARERKHALLVSASLSRALGERLSGAQQLVPTQEVVVEGGMLVSMPDAFPPLVLVASKLGARVALPGRATSFGSPAHVADSLALPIGGPAAWGPIATRILPDLGPAPAAPSGGLAIGRTPGPRRQLVALAPAVLDRHVAVVGATGAGKTTLLKSIVRSAVARGDRAVIVLDPHGDLCDDLLAAAPPADQKRYVLLDFGDPDHAPGLNVLAASTDAERELAIGTLDQYFLGLFGPEIWGPRIADAFRNLAKLTSYAGLTLVDTLRALDALYDDDEVATLEAIALKSNDPGLPIFLRQVRARTVGDGSARELAPYFRAKLSPFCDPMLLRTVLGQTRGLDFSDLLRQKAVVLVNLAKGRVSSRGASLLGSLLLAEIAKAILRQGDVAVDQRKRVLVVADEFQNLVGEASIDILAESRKYGGALVAGLQNLEQLEGQRMGRVVRTSARGALLGNSGATIAFRCGASDADALARQLGDAVEPAELVSLPDFVAVARVVGGAPFLVRTAPPSADDATSPIAGEVREASRRWLTRPRVEIDAEIRRRAEAPFGAAPAPAALRMAGRLRGVGR